MIIVYGFISCFVFCLPILVILLLISVILENIPKKIGVVIACILSAFNLFIFSKGGGGLLIQYVFVALITFGGCYLILKRKFVKADND